MREAVFDEPDFMLGRLEDFLDGVENGNNHSTLDMFFVLALVPIIDVIAGIHDTDEILVQIGLLSIFVQVDSMDYFLHQAGLMQDFVLQNLVIRFPNEAYNQR